MSRGGRDSDTLKKYKLKVLELLNQGLNAYNVSKLVGCSPSSISKWYPELCDRNRNSNKKLTDSQKEQIKECRNELKTYKQISEHTGATKEQIKRLCRTENLYYSDTERKAIIDNISTSKRKSEEQISKDIADISNNRFKYCGNYQRNKDEFHIDIECCLCGNKKSISSSTIRAYRRNHTSPVCTACKTQCTQ